jgi:hypothetical protein
VLGGTPVFDAVLRTGISATLVSGGIRSHVIPTEAVATAQRSHAARQSIDSVVARLRRVIHDSSGP